MIIRQIPLFKLILKPISKLAEFPKICKRKTFTKSCFLFLFLLTLDSFKSNWYQNLKRAFLNRKEITIILKIKVFSNKWTFQKNRAVSPSLSYLTIRDINLNRIIGNHKIYHSESFLGTWNIYVPGQLRAKSSNLSMSEQISAWFAIFRFFVPWMSLDLLKVEMRYKILQELLSLKSSRVLAENLRTRFFSDMRFSQDDGGHPFLSFSTVCSQKIFSFV